MPDQTSTTSPARLRAAHDPLRPHTLSDFAGQPAVAGQLQIILNAAAGRGQLAPHLLFSGPPGLGKTTLANIVAAELGVEMVTTSGPALAKPGDLAGLLTAIAKPTTLFIDEIHRMDRKVEELLYSAMEDGLLDVKLGEGPDARVLRVALEPFTLIGATTQLGLVSAPLRDRFGYVARLNLYDDDALQGIVSRSAAMLGVTVDDPAAGAIASRSRGTPRVANQLLARVRDWAQVSGRDQVGPAEVDAALDTFGIDPIGLDELGQAILSALCRQFRGGPVGVSTLAAAVGEQATTLETVYEPFLLRRGLLQRTPRGRIATDAGFEHLGMEPPPHLGGRVIPDGTDEALPFPNF